jgi:hypothetical protein
MAERYPLVHQREYQRAQQRGGWLRRRTSRGDDELPPLAPHQVRVFRVGEEYIEDHGRLGPEDSVVVAASSVTVVDQSVGRRVVVEMRIPSAEVGEFTLRTTFQCSVTDACAVVRDGVTNVEALLLGYLLGIPGLTEEGGDLRIVESATVRRRVDARLTAYLEMRPPAVSGLKALPTAIDVLTPAELAAHLREVEEARIAREKQRLRDELEEERTRAEAEKERLREEIRREDALTKELNRQEQERLRTDYERSNGAQGQEHDLMLQAQRNGFVRNQMTEDFRLIGHDPIAADFNAWRNGDISADTLSDRLRAAEARRYDRDDERTKRDREYHEQQAVLQRQDAERQAALVRDEYRYRLDRADKLGELSRQERIEDSAARRKAEELRLTKEREDAKAQREEAQLQRQEAREWAKQRLVVNHDLGRRVIDRGLVDNAIIDMGAFINSVGEIPQYGTGPVQTQEAQKASAERLDKFAAGAVGAGTDSGAHPDAEVVDSDAHVDGDDHDRNRNRDEDRLDESDLDIGPADAEANVGD